MNTDTKIRRVTALLEGDFRELAKLDAAEAFGKKIDEANSSGWMPTTALSYRNMLAKDHWLEARRKQAVIDRVTDKLCPPEPIPDDLIDAMSYAFAPAIKRPNDFGVIAINSVV